MDIRKNLDFIGMRNFSLSLNGALIKSKVKFEPGAKEKDRPMPVSYTHLARLSVTTHVSEAKASLNRAYSRQWQTRNQVIYPWPG